VELSEYLYLFWRRRAVISIAFLSVVITVGVYVFRLTPLYEADCKLLLIEDKSALLANSPSTDLMLQTLGQSDPVSTQIEIVRTRPILADVIALAGVVDARGRPERTDVLKVQLKVEGIRNTNLISVSYRNPNPQRAAAVINTLARVYVERNQKLNQEAIASSKAFIEGQLAIQKELVQQAGNRTLEFKKSNGIFSLEDEAQGLATAQAQLETTRIQLETQLKGAMAQKADLAAKINAPGALSDRFYAYWTTTLEQVDSQITSLMAQQKNTATQIDDLKVRLGRLPPNEAELARLVRDEKIATDIYTGLLSQYEEVRVNQAAKIASVRLIEPAVEPDTPVFPQKTKYLLLAALLGLLLGFSAAILMEHFDDSLRSLAEVKEILPYDVLGYVPYHKSRSMLFMATAPRSPVSEALRLVQANFKFKPIAQEKSFSVMVTSAMPGEGKSTLAANLCLAFAGSGSRAAVVSLDLRRPVFDVIFDRKMTKGITDYLIGESTLEDIMVGENGRGITIVPSGTVPPNPSELVSSKKVPELMRYLKEHFDVVVYDTPPITLVAETLDLARYVDGIILVVDTSIATRSALHAMNDLVSNKDLVILGTVLNNVNRRGRSYHYYGGYLHGDRYYTKPDPSR
jgi:succinoglycan biosynthesis transport protein ExoP